MYNNEYRWFENVPIRPIQDIKLEGKREVPEEAVFPLSAIRIASRELNKLENVLGAGNVSNLLTLGGIIVESIPVAVGGIVGSGVAAGEFVFLRSILNRILKHYTALPEIKQLALFEMGE
jgi:hypothetical protein